MRKQRTLLAFATIVSLVLGSPCIARADPIRIDQISPVVGGRGVGCCIDEDWAQTFTVGMTGTLRTLALPLSRPNVSPDDDFSGGLGIQLRSTVGGAPGDLVLAEMILGKSSLPLNTPEVRFEFTTFMSGLNIPIVAGQQLAIVLSNVGHNGQNIRWAMNEPGYARGAPFRQPRENTGMTGDRGDVTGPWVAGRETFGDLDFAFFTSVEPAAMPSPTPEPGTALLLGSGLLWIARRARRAKRV